MRRILFDQGPWQWPVRAYFCVRAAFPEIYFLPLSLFSALDNARQVLFFIHNGHKTVTAIPCKPHNHAALECNSLKKILKSGSVFFNRRTKYAFGNSTYLLFVETIHNVIHKDCGQFFRPCSRFVEAVKCDDANLPVPAMQFKVSRFF